MDPRQSQGWGSVMYGKETGLDCTFEVVNRDLTGITQYSVSQSPVIITQTWDEVGSSSTPPLLSVEAPQPFGERRGGFISGGYLKRVCVSGWLCEQGWLETAQGKGVHALVC